MHVDVPVVELLNGGLEGLTGKSLYEHVDAREDVETVLRKIRDCLAKIRESGEADAVILELEALITEYGCSCIWGTADTILKAILKRITISI